MIERIEGIVTDIIKHNDRHNVVTLYTRSRGRMAFLVPVGSSRSGRMRNSVINLMAVISADVNITSGKELYTLRQPTPLRLWHGIYANPVKSSMLFFITEFCNRLLRQYPPDEHLWKYLSNSLELLDCIPSAKIANFHITFLIGLMKITGIEPSPASWEPGMRFDMARGEMVDGESWLRPRGSALLTQEESRWVPLLLRLNFRNMTLFRFSRDQRQQILDRLIAYYSIHLPLGSSFKSLDVLRELFS